MSDDRDSGEPRPPEPGVFANLPDSRPGPRSPRRDAASRASSKAVPKQKQKPKARAKPATRTRPVAGARPRTRESGETREPATPPEPSPASAAGLEDIAWAGVAAAAEAATIGVRLASKAIEALRGNPERR